MRQIKEVMMYVGRILDRGPAVHGNTQVTYYASNVQRYYSLAWVRSIVCVATTLLRLAEM